MTPAARMREAAAQIVNRHAMRWDAQYAAVLDGIIAEIRAIPEPPDPTGTEVSRGET